MRVAAVLLASALLTTTSLHAQSDATHRSFPGLFGVGPDRGARTLIHPEAPSIMRSDQARETLLEQLDAQKRIARDKMERLIQLRNERDRRVAAAVARLAPSAPFRSPETNRIPDTADRTVTSTAPQGTPSTGTSPRPWAPPPNSLPGKIAAAADQVAGKINEGVFGSPASKPTPPGLLALALIGMFLVPALGVGFIIIGVAHLRGHSFVSGTIMSLTGALILWGAFYAVRQINPNLPGPGPDSRQAHVIGSR